jgi:hypothetical protein|tara:strand:- start:1969 stop:3159 length:1191 start_codon:yes stop_codon:yes gene_type:complete
MAYWKIIPAGSSSNTTNMTLFRQAIAGIIGGTYSTLAELQAATGLSGAINLGACTKIGTNPTSGMYSIASQTSTNYSSSWAAYSWQIQVKKYHYAKDQVSGFDPYHYIRIDAGPHQTDGGSADGAGFRLTWENAAGAARFPNTNRTHFWNGALGASKHGYRLAAAYAAGGSGLYEIHLILNDTTFFMWVKANSASDQSADIGTWMASDFEFDSVIDTYHHSINTSNYPGECHWTFNKANLLKDAGTALGTTAYAHALGTGRAGYLKEDGSGYTDTHFSDEAVYHHGPPQTNYYAFNYPVPQSTFGTSEDASGPVHFLHPVSYVGNGLVSSNSGAADPRIARLMNVYRTTDNLAIGERIKVGSDYYRAFRTHNCGETDPDTADQRACFAFPENNVPY